MSQITVINDSILKKSEIVMPLLSSSKAEAGSAYKDSRMTDKAQTTVFGIQTPLVAINSTVINFDEIVYFNLKSTGRLPELILTVNDKQKIIANIDKPGQDNEVRVQILPRHDNTYKKIDLTFYITNIQVNGALIRLTCVYKVPTFMSSNFKALGLIDTYTLFKTASEETGMGFASNVAKLKDDRYVYLDNRSWNDILESEIKYSNTTEHILDWWVDFWDNITLADIKERYNTVDANEDIMIWADGQINEVTVDVETVPTRVPAVIHNNPVQSASELYIKDIVENLNPGIQVSKGSDKVYAVYEDMKEEYLDHLIQNGDIKEDIFTKYEYLGECYGEYNYLLSKSIRDAFIQKMNSESMKVTLQAPLVSLMRGHKVNFMRYVNDDMVENKMKALEKEGLINRNVESNIPLADYEVEEESSNGTFTLDKTVSGQYLITEINIVYNGNEWNYTLTLVRPTQNKPNIKS